jgi:hypothetical protein
LRFLFLMLRQAWYIQGMASRKPTRHRYASATNKHIAPVINRLYRFHEAAKAQQKLDYIQKQFTISNQQLEDHPEPHFILWVGDYDVSDAEAEEGYMGHYALFSYEELEDGTYTLCASKIETELKYHPRRKRKKTPMPNFGHPLLRKVKRGKIYATIEEITADLQALHLEYPDTTIPGENKLFLMIFSRAHEGNPVQRYVLKMVHVQGGGFTFELTENNHTPKETKRPAPEEAESEPMPTGHFASMVALRRNKKSHTSSS